MTKTRATQTAALTRGIIVAAIGTALGMASVGCKNNQVGQQAPIVDGNAATDPAVANMADPNAANTAYLQSGSMQPVYPQGSSAPFSGPRAVYPRTAAPITRVAGQVYQNPGNATGENYPNQAPFTQNESSNYQSQQQQPYDPNASAQDDQLYSELLDPNTPAAQQPPPPLPTYEQPPAPGPDYLWTPGYWDYANTGYYYVPGNWVAAPFVGALWTPGWWGSYGGAYRWHRGYWGPHVGYYGGINYGFGFIGFGYQGGYWNRDHFYYNTYVNHVRPEVVNNYVYNRHVTVVNNTYINNTRTSYFGGPGGLQRRPAPAEFAAVRETRMQPLPGQVMARQQAAQNQGQFFANNHGRPNMLFASNPVAQHNVAVPPQLQHLQQNPQVFQQRVQAEQQQRVQQQQSQQFRANEQQQRIQADQQRQQQGQQFRANEQQQRLQADQQRQQENQAFHANEQQQRLQQQQQQQHVQVDQQRQQAMNQQRVQADQQRQHLEQQRVQADQQRQQAMNQQREQHMQAQVQQRQQQAQVQSQQRAQADQQRIQQAQQHQAAPQRVAPAPHVEAPHPAPAPHEGGHPR